METIIIVTTTDVTIEKFIDMLPDSFRKEKQLDGRYFISSEIHYCWIEYDDEIESYYDEDEMLIVKKHIPKPKFFTCEFTEIEFGKKILSHLISDNQFVIDNDHGELLTGEEFIKRLKDDPDWDWRI
ncbi:MAG: hypothetical protein HQK77_04675 [Desulfobacterales bacterium]|nr:hypothetical protein [Desulfobacterales bacterium]